MDDWLLAYDGYDPQSQPLREALCTIGNGHFCTRGAFEEKDAGGPHYPGTYHAGGYDRAVSRVADRQVANEDLVNWPNWLPLSFRPEGGEWLDLDRQELLSHEQTLDLRCGLLTRSFRVRDAGGRRTRITSRRVASMANPHVAALEWTLVPENWSGPLTIRTALDGSVVNDGVARYRDLESRHLIDHGAWEIDDEAMMLRVRASQSRIAMAQGARTRIFDDRGAPLPHPRETSIGEQGVEQTLRVEAREGRPLRIEKVVTVHSSLGRGYVEPSETGERLLRSLAGFDSILEHSRRAWERLWRRCDIRVANGEDVQGVVRLHVFHLLQTASRNSTDLDVGIPARGLHGEAYRGHVFWDELFIFPFLNLRIPQITRSLLLYRFRRLDEARRAAREAGFEGALFPWQSGSDGREESQSLHLNPESGRWIPDNTHLQRHVNAAIAYNVWQHYQATLDIDFFATYGAEIILAIARFWASAAEWDGDKGRYVIRKVVGPDEYHDAYPDAEEPGLDNNAYTNVMAAWCLRTALAALDELGTDRRKELEAALEITEGELQRFREIGERMYVPFHDDGIISQFEGYEGLRELDWEDLRQRHGDIHRLDRILEAEGDSPNRYKAGKQADVLMLFYLFTSEELTELFTALGYEFDPKKTIPKNIEYYIERTSHGSTLSRMVHSWVLARADRESWGCFSQALRSDVEDVQGGTTPEGIHLGAMAGTVDLVQRCYGGILMYGNQLRIAPRMPDQIECLEMSIRYRERWLLLRLASRRVTVRFLKGWHDTVELVVGDTPLTLRRGEERTVDLA